MNIIRYLNILYYMRSSCVEKVAINNNIIVENIWCNRNVSTYLYACLNETNILTFEQ